MAELVETPEATDNDSVPVINHEAEVVTEEPIEAPLGIEVEEDEEEDLPEKYRGKSLKDIVFMHQEAEKALGRKGSEVGELRKVVDEYIKSQISVIMDKYKKLVEAIKSRFSYATLILFDIYYPTSEEYKKYYSAIRIWNKMQYKYAKQNNIRMVEVSKLLNKKEDFNNKIEPSEEGGQKIVTAIVRSISTK